MDRSSFDSLLDKYLREAITPEETRQLFAMLDEPDCQEVLKEYIGQDLETRAFGETEDIALVGRIRERLLSRRKEDRTRTGVVRLRRLSAVAAVLLVVIAGLWLWSRNGADGRVPAKEGQIAGIQNDLPPGRDGAILTLADGTRVNLDSTGNGNLSRQGSSRLIKTTGQLAYDGGRERGGAVVFNTITTPPAHQFQVLLADGTKVWLNASSSLRYPTAFAGRDRVVELQGEGYFEVKYNAAHPFKVRTAGTEIEDLGTQFNIMSYPDEAAIKTTLVEGAVSVSAGGRSSSLKPGEQAVVKGQEVDVLHDADVEEAVAWKNGVFLMKGEDVAATMRQIGRWYDVEIVYKGAVPKGHVMGDIPRAMSLSGVVELFRQFNISCTLEGRKLIVSAR